MRLSEQIHRLARPNETTIWKSFRHKGWKFEMLRDPRPDNKIFDKKRWMIWDKKHAVALTIGSANHNTEMVVTLWRLVFDPWRKVEGEHFYVFPLPEEMHFVKGEARRQLTFPFSYDQSVTSQVAALEVALVEHWDEIMSNVRSLESGRTPVRRRY